MYAFRLETDNGEGPYRGNGKEYIGDKLINHKTPQDQYSYNDPILQEILERCDEGWVFSWSQARLVARYIKDEFVHAVDASPYKVGIYHVRNPDAQRTTPDGQRVFDKDKARLLRRIPYTLFLSCRHLYNQFDYPLPSEEEEL